MGATNQFLLCCALSALVFSTPLPDRNETSTLEPDYTGYKILTILAGNHSTLVSFLQKLQASHQIDVWASDFKSATVMVSGAYLDDVTELIRHQGLDFSIKNDNVQRYLEEDFNRRRREKRATSLDITNTYLGLAEINTFLQSVASAATRAKVQLSVMGRSFEGRDVPVVNIRHPSSSSVQKYVIALDAGIHAREWISTSVLLNVINKLAFNPDNDPIVSELLEKFDWTIAPVLNPDGYEYSRESSSKRLWRKTRTTKYSVTCPGVDINRNFGFDWNPESGGSRNLCSDVYSGPFANSEPETLNVQNWLKQQNGRIAAYVTTHSFGQYILYPYGSTPARTIEKKNLLVDVGTSFVNAMASLSRTYLLGNSAELLYPAAGGSDDYAKGALGVALSYTLELPPSTMTEGGFILPESGIASVAKETWHGLKIMSKRIFDIYGYYTTAVPTTMAPITRGSLNVNALWSDFLRRLNGKK